MAQVAQALSTSMLEFLEWVRFRPRTHAEAIEAWQSHCPRVTLWEDALDQDLIQLHARSQVRLTSRGRAALAANTRA
jgi:hypothetical protein